MNVSPPESRAAPSGFRRVAPALVLFFLAPFVGEFLLGDFSIDAFGIILPMAPMYGGGALAIREIARRLGRGWPTMLVLALAYGLIEEGIAIQTLFNPHYLGFHLLAAGWVPVLGIGVWWTAFVLTLHVVWSISVPIALVEGLFAERRTQPWLRRPGLAVSLALLAAGYGVIHHFTRMQDPFSASAAQELSVGAIVIVLVIAALWRRDRSPAGPGAVPGVWLVGIAALALGLAFMTANRVLQGWTLAAAQWAMDAVGAMLLLAWSRRAGWTPLHTLAAAGGALLTYACTAFGQTPVKGGTGTIALASHLIFAAVAIALLIAALNRQKCNNIV